MTETIYTIRGRNVNQAELASIRLTIKQYRSKGRTAIARHLCRQWNWRQANGTLKERACRAVLVTLEEKGLIGLPPRQRGNTRRRSKNTRQLRYDINTSVIAGKLSDFSPPSLTLAQSSADKALWDYLIDHYHYLGNPAIVGAHLKYLAFIDDRPVACLGWGSPAWQVACRDNLIGWDSAARMANLDQIVNNVRFLILPWVRIPHLASKVLAANMQPLKDDWMDYYSHPVALLETFVDQSRFKGTCYKAANWSFIGETVGRGKYGAVKGTCPVKSVWIYPLVARYRERLRG